MSDERDIGRVRRQLAQPAHQPRAQLLQRRLAARDSRLALAAKLTTSATVNTWLEPLDVGLARRDRFGDERGERGLHRGVELLQPHLHLLGDRHRLEQRQLPEEHIATIDSLPSEKCTLKMPAKSLRWV